jgi:hypothetical protein
MKKERKKEKDASSLPASVRGVHKPHDDANSNNKLYSNYSYILNDRSPINRLGMVSSDSHPHTDL